MLDASQQICLFLDRSASRLHGVSRMVSSSLSPDLFVFLLFVFSSFASGSRLSWLRSERQESWWLGCSVPSFFKRKKEKLNSVLLLKPSSVELGLSSWTIVGYMLTGRRTCSGVKSISSFFWVWLFMETLEARLVSVLSLRWIDRLLVTTLLSSVMKLVKSCINHLTTGGPLILPMETGLGREWFKELPVDHLGLLTGSRRRRSTNFRVSSRRFLSSRR